jgi:hypothetical protein
MMWKDWGFAAAVYGQAKHFLDVAKTSQSPAEKDGYVRAAFVFLVMSVEAHFYEVVRGFIQTNRANLPSKGLDKVEEELKRNTGLQRALREWPQHLTGKSLDLQGAPYLDLIKIIDYRNWLVHGKIAQTVPSWGILAQEIETIENAEAATKTVALMVTQVSQHFGFKAPDWH